MNSHTHTMANPARQWAIALHCCTFVVRMTGVNLAAWPCFPPECPRLVNEQGKNLRMMKRAFRERRFRAAVVTQTAGIQVICSPRHVERFTIKDSVITTIGPAEAESWHLHNVSRFSLSALFHEFPFSSSSTAPAKKHVAYTLYQCTVGDLKRFTLCALKETISEEGEEVLQEFATENWDFVISCGEITAKYRVRPSNNILGIRKELMCRMLAGSGSGRSMFVSLSKVIIWSESLLGLKFYLERFTCGINAFSLGLSIKWAPSSTESEHRGSKIKHFNT